MNSTLAKFTIFSILFAAVHCASAQDDAQQDIVIFAKPLEYTLVLPAVKEFPRGIRFANKIGCEIVYMLKSEKAGTVIKKIKDAITINSITDKEGNDLSQDVNGKVTWHTDNGTTYQNGECATFSVFVATETPMLIPNIKGSVNVKVASKTETKNLVFKTADIGIEQKAGPYIFAIEKNKENDTGYIRIRMNGDQDLVANMTLEDGEKTFINYTGANIIGNTAFYFFAPAPKTPKFTLSVTYYTDMKEVSVPFGQDATEGAAP